MSDFLSTCRVEPLTRQHDRAAFSCGIEELDQYLRQQARQDAEKRAAAPFVIVTAATRIVGYYTLSSAIILATELSPEIVRKNKWPRYPELPATLIGRLASDRAFRGKRVGESLLMDAMKRAWLHSQQVASLAVVVDAKDDNARQFYIKYFFVPFPDRHTRLFLPMTTIEDLFTP